MAKAAATFAMPLDQPISIAPGVTHREDDFQGNAKWGFGQNLFDHVGKAKGNRPFEALPPRMALTHAGAPYSNLRKGK